MNYQTRLYLNTGFNAVNIPDSGALLDNCAHFDATAVEIMQNRFLDKIRVRATWDYVKDCDYIRLLMSDANYYFVTGIRMLATDVAELSVLFDYVTSAGGVGNLNILDGVTSRVHVTDDTFGKYCENDPLTMPAQPLEIQSIWMRPSSSAHTYVESTINLPKTGATLNGKAYLVEDQQSVIIPTVEELDSFTRYKLDNRSDSVNPHTMLYDLNDATPSTYGNGWGNQKAILKGEKRARELGIEQGAIINQVVIPTAYAEASHVDTSEELVDSNYIDADGNLVYHTQAVIDRKITEFTGKTGEEVSNIPYEYSGARNNRLNYGEFTKYGLISCSGESCEYNAEDIIDGNNASPSVKWIADPHTDGKPYFRWRRVNGDSTDIGFFKNCISGLRWKQVPLFYSEPSGTALNTLKYQNSRNVTDVGYENRYRTREYNAKFGIAAAAIGQVAQGNILGAIGATIGAGLNAGSLVVDQMNDENAYRAQKQSEMSDYIVTNTVAAPTINFPYNSEVMRDFFGNGVLMYRYKYSANDINRIDKLLTMYGYRCTKALESSDFYNRTYFNYVECANVSVTGHAKWMNDGIAMMLKNGVRVWHVLPDVTYYNTENPVR